MDHVPCESDLTFKSSGYLTFISLKSQLIRVSNCHWTDIRMTNVKMIEMSNCLIFHMQKNDLNKTVDVRHSNDEPQNDSNVKLFDI